MNKLGIQNILGLIALWVIAGNTTVFGQELISPYSSIALGDITLQGNVRNQGMGGVGVALPSINYSSQLNAAMLTSNFYTMLEVNYLGGYKQASSQNVQSESYNGNLTGLSLTFPVVQTKYGMSVGIRPVTQVGYRLSSSEWLPKGTLARYVYTGVGGITQAYWAHGVKIWKGLNLGLEANYNFGSITNESRSLLVDPYTSYITDLKEQTTFSDVTFTPSLFYQTNVDSALYLTAGLKYERKVDLDVEFTRLFLRQTSSGAIISADTVRQANSQVTMPQQITAGLGLYRPFHYAFGVDLTLSKWSDYENEIRSNDLADAFRLSVGGEWTPDANSISNYFKRVTYRAGFRYERTPWVVNDVQINDIGITFGLSMPVSRGLSTLNWSFAAGQRGDLDSGHIQERYFRVGIGLSINDPQWFRRRRIN